MNASTKESMDFTPFTQFGDVSFNSPPSTRLEQSRAIAKKFRETVLGSGTVTYYRSFDLVRVPYPVKYGFNNIVQTPSPYLHILNRMYVVQYVREGKKKTLLFSPSDILSNSETPFFHRLGKSFGIFEDFGKMMIAPVVRTVEQALQLTGISPSQVDYLSFDHLHTQDLRKWLEMGTIGDTFPMRNSLSWKKSGIP